MEHLPMTERHALKFTALAITQQQRILKKLANQARLFASNKENNNAAHKEAAAADAKHYDWQVKVRLSREARAVHLIRAFLKGLPYLRVENSLKYHTRPAALIVQEYMPFTLTTQQDDFSRAFNAWLLVGQEKEEKAA